MNYTGICLTAIELVQDFAPCPIGREWMRRLTGNIVVGMPDAFLLPFHYP